MNLLGIVKNDEKFSRKSIEKLNIELICYGDSLATIVVKRGIFQDDSLSPLQY